MFLMRDYKSKQTDGLKTGEFLKSVNESGSVFRNKEPQFSQKYEDGR